MKKLIQYALLVSVFSRPVGLLWCQRTRAISAADCVTTRYLLSDDSLRNPIQISPNSKSVAYLVKIPNLLTDRNDVQIFVKKLPAAPNDPGKLILTADGLSGLQWLGDNEHLAFLMSDSGHVSVFEVDVDNGQRRVLASVDSDITEFSIDAKGDTFVFATRDDTHNTNAALRSDQVSVGYRVPYQQELAFELPAGRLFIKKKDAQGRWRAPPEAISLEDPFTKKKRSSIPYSSSLRLSLSPDGKSLAVAYLESSKDISPAWLKSPQLRSILDSDSGFAEITVVKDLSNGRTFMPIATPVSYSLPRWSPDSQSFVIVSQSPVNSTWEQQDINAHVSALDSRHLFWVSMRSGETKLIAPRVVDSFNQPLWWESDGNMIVQTMDDSISTLSFDGVNWQEGEALHIPNPESAALQDITSDGKSVLGEYERLSTPPEVFAYQVGAKKLDIFANLNPQFASLIFAEVRNISWKTSTGYYVRGLLLMPPDYREGERYPLVIQTKPTDERSFVCDSGATRYPSFAPEPIANAGVIYLIRTESSLDTAGEEQSHYPKGYPGQIGEAVFQMDVWDSAIASLDRQGLIDRKKMGIIGYSRSGWYTEFILAHSANRFRAATATDNIQYSVGAYWLLHTAGTMQSSDAVMGGPPYGKTLENWVDYSISFNIENIHTPLLMEAMGYGVQDNSVGSIPTTLALSYEVFAGLSRLQKPVELYYYPDEGHRPDHPQARLASLQRNLDWYRFWLQGYERPNPEDPDQYKRWEHLRVLRDADAKAAGQSAASASKSTN